MLDKIVMILEKDCQLQIGDLLLVGVSGGPDSLCLMHILHALGYNFIIAHINHQLRPQADEEASLVKQFARDMNVECISTRVNVFSYVEQNSISVEEAARLMRYQFLFKQAEQRAAKAVLVGHNADDQVETILLHFLRGTGLSGLRGMDFKTIPNPWSDHIPLLRPLLSTSRAAIQAYLAEHNLHPLCDQSNQDTTYFRNRVRLELLPILEKYNPRIRANLLRMSQIVRDDYQVLQNNVSSAWENCLVNQDAGYLSFRLSAFVILPVSIQRYVLRKAINYHLPGLRDVGYECIERGIDFLNHGKENGQVDILAGVRIIKEGDLFWVASWQAELPDMDFPSLPAGQQLTLNIPSTIELSNGWKMRALEISDDQKGMQKSVETIDPFQAWIAVDSLQLPLTIRTRRVGELIKPLGMQGHSVKISDLMINLKIPKRARNTWPLVSAADEIVWVPCYRVSYKASIKPDSQQIVKLILSREPTP
jgi:tRNA(Ile)-lysidine synthase